MVQTHNNNYMVIRDNDHQVMEIFYWGDDREVPDNYEIPEGCTMIKIPWSMVEWFNNDSKFIYYSFIVVDINNPNYDEAFIKTSIPDVV